MIPHITTATLTTLDGGGNTGWAYWDRYMGGWSLAACGLYRPLKDHRPPHVAINCSAQTVVVECPVYQKGDSPKRTNDLYKTTQRGCIVAGYLRPSIVHIISPHEWKGGVPKDLQNQRTIDRLTVQELEIVRQLVGKLDDVLDAVGIGLVVLGRW